ncbi:MAG TPA: nucleotidyltransferase family protein [Allosphingosinicella sp.]|nr:nucleotidyltransferase family protein [Allosphingosinicella sp.]
MDRDAIIQRLREHEGELRELGVCRLSLFGSVARGEAGPGSDVDLAVTLDPTRRIGLFRYAALREQIEDLLGVSVDMVSEPIERPRLRARIEQDRVHVF